MVSRAIRATSVGLAYFVAGIPALIGTPASTSSPPSARSSATVR
jgi:hypothetical protein